jgi:hypothetical protein
MAQQLQANNPASYLDAALDELEAKHINRGKVDWPALRRKAREMAKQAKSPADTYAAIDYVIDALGEKHTLLYAAPKPKQPDASAGTAARAPYKMPEPVGELIDGIIGYLRIPQFGAAPDHPDADLFVAMSRRILLKHDRDGVCGWIVDLRGNGGGNVWPMVDGLVPLLAPRVGTAPYWFFDIDGKITPVVLKDGRLIGDGVPERPAFETRTVKSKDAPIAILIDGDTASSAETIAVAFHGLPGVRFFGEPSANRVTVNNPVRLSDGAIIQMTVGYMVRRDGTRQQGSIQPDEVTEGALAREAAIRWLSQTCEQPRTP